MLKHTSISLMNEKSYIMLSEQLQAWALILAAARLISNFYFSIIKMSS
jgi:hypothetical protein